jgi:hypothetical protein
MRAGIRQAEAEVRLGLSFGKPEYGLGLRYAREEDDHVLLAGVTFTLPLFSRGQEQRSGGSARKKGKL